MIALIITGWLVCGLFGGYLFLKTSKRLFIIESADVVFSAFITVLGPLGLVAVVVGTLMYEDSFNITKLVDFLNKVIK